mmetsp:Transcript_15930/g.39657  ORF Transcript_15930/g.39657 Transcript_15930/m.39657 type:complete len:253 (+) Transcript_15930:145-903(+)
MVALPAARQPGCHGVVDGGHGPVGSLHQDGVQPRHGLDRRAAAGDRGVAGGADPGGDGRAGVDVRAVRRCRGGLPRAVHLAGLHRGAAGPGGARARDARHHPAVRQRGRAGVLVDRARVDGRAAQGHGRVRGRGGHRAGLAAERGRGVRDAGGVPAGAGHGRHLADAQPGRAVVPRGLPRAQHVWPDVRGDRCVPTRVQCLHLRQGAPGRRPQVDQRRGRRHPRHGGRHAAAVRVRPVAGGGAGGAVCAHAP